eukprot:g16450.t1
MSGKRAAPKSVGASSVSQPSILSFFGKGGNTAAPTPKTSNSDTQSDGAKPQRNRARAEGTPSTPSTTCTPAAKRRKKASAAARTVVLTAAQSSASSSPPAEEDATPPPPTTPAAGPGATAAAKTPGNPPRGSSSIPRKTTPPNRPRGESGSPPPAGGAAAAATPRAPPAKGATTRGDGESDTPSPTTDSESSPSVALSDKHTRREGGGSDGGGGVAAARARRRSRQAAATRERKEAREAIGRDSARSGTGEKEEPGRGRSDRQPGRKKGDTVEAIPVGGGDVPVREEEEEHEGDETDGEGEKCSDDGGSDHAAGGVRNRNPDDGRRRRDDVEGAQAEGEEDDKPEAKPEEERGQHADGGMSQYELQRLERIKRNQAFMATLGLATAKPPAPAPSGAARAAKGRSKKRSRPVSRVKEKAPTVPVRRSARARGAEAVDYNEDKQAASVIATAARAVATRAPEPEPEPVLEEIDFDDSTVLKYLCGGEEVKASDSPTSSAAAPNGAKVVGLRVLEPDNPMAAAGLSTIYTMHFGGYGGGGGTAGGALPLLAAGGKGGIVALFSTRRQQQEQSRSKHRSDDSEEREEEDERTLMNFKAHKGWVSAVRFLKGNGGGGSRGAGGGGACRLLSSANDSVVKLWDTSKQHRGLPRLLCTVDDLHPTRKGIFSMDSYGARVATGSKDSTVSLASLRPTGLECSRVLGDPGGSEAFHVKVVKGVSLRDENMVASCGDDSNVRVSDLRSPSSFGVSHRLDGVHDGPCHTVRWHPFDSNLLMSAGLDAAIKLHDLRRLDAPLHVFRGHCPYALVRPRAIHRPEFFFPAAGTSGGKGNADDDRASVNVLSCGERSEKLSMYDARTGATVSRGVLGAEASALAVCGGGWSGTSSGAGAVAAALPGGSVVLLEPVWGSD